MKARFTQFFTLMVALFCFNTAFAQPANNECSGAVDISSSFVAGETNTTQLFDNTGATNEASDPTTGAACFFENSIDNTVWVSFMGDGNTYSIRSTQCTATNYITDGDTQFAVYSGACGALVPEACNEDGPAAVAGNYYAEVSVETVAGVTYYMMIDGYLAVEGEFCLEVEEYTEITDCNAGTFTTPDTIIIPQGGTFTLEREGEIIPNSPVAGFYRYMLTPAGGNPQYIIGAPNPGTWDADLNGIMSGTFNAPPLTGTWIIEGIVATDGSSFANLISSTCSTTPPTVLIFEFDEVTACNAGQFTNADTLLIEPGGTFELTFEGDTVPNSPAQGNYAYLFGPEGEDPIVFIGADNPAVLNSDLNGTLSGFGLPAMTGVWTVTGIIYTDNSSFAAAIGSICSQTEPTTLIFQIPDCVVGNLISTTPVQVCAQDSFMIGTADQTLDTFPAGGGYGYLFDDSPGGTGGQAGGTLVTGANPTYWNSDLNGILSGQPTPIAPLAGPYSVRIFTYASTLDPFGTICGISQDSMLVIFGSEFSASIIDNMNDTYTANPGVTNIQDFSFVWSDGQEGFTATLTEMGTYTVTITETASGCTQTASVEVGTINTNESDIINHLVVAPNPTKGVINVAMELPSTEEVQVSVIDATGRVLMNNAPETFSASNFELDLTAQPSGMYIVRFRIGDDVVTRRVIKQ